MEHWNKPAAILSNYYPAAIRDILFRLPSLIPLAFLFHLQRNRKDIYKTYKTSVFRICYAYAFLTMPFFYLDAQMFVRSYFTSLNQTTVIFCSVFKGTVPYFTMSFDAYLLSETIVRYLSIVWNYEVPVWIFICLCFAFEFKQWSYGVTNPFLGVLTKNDACSPLLSGTFLGGYATTAMALVGFNLVTCLLNLRILWFMKQHFKKSQGKILSPQQEKDKENLVKGLILNSFLPTITSSLTVYQMALAKQFELLLIIMNPLSFLAKTVSFLRVTCPYVFLRYFQQEILYFITFRRKKTEARTIKVFTTNTASATH